MSGAVTTFPLQLATVSAGFAALSPGLRALGASATQAAASALSAELGMPVRIGAVPVPSPASPSLGTSDLVFDLAVPGGTLVLEVDARLACGLAALLAGGSGDVAPAREVLPAERGALELLALVSLDGARGVPAIAALAPRLVREGTAGDGALAVEFSIEVGTLRGCARALVSRGALASTAPASAADLPDIHITAGLQRGTLSLTAEEAAAIRSGDVVLLDPGTPVHSVLFPGGVVLTGRLDGAAFTVEERKMNEWSGSFPIAISVETARVTVALRDLAGLAPGAVLPLHVGRDGRVVLRVGDAPIGRGELVEVDGALAVRIAAWSWEGCE